MRNRIKVLTPAVALLISLLISLPTAQSHAEAKTKQKPKPSPSPTINISKYLEDRRISVASRSASRYGYATPRYNQVFAYTYMLHKYNWGGKQFACLVTLWNRESGWRVNAHNSSSGAHGIPQSLPGNKMAKFGKNWKTDPKVQIRWGLHYIQNRYSTPCSALNHSYSYGWY
jgi:hypothetical protein